MHYAIYILSGNWQLLVEGTGNDSQVKLSADKIHKQFGLSVKAYRGRALLYSV